MKTEIKGRNCCTCGKEIEIAINDKCKSCFSTELNMLECFPNVSKIVFMNCSIITTSGIFEKRPIHLSYVKKLLTSKPFSFAIGHESTAQIISELLDVEIPVNRIRYEQKKEDLCIIFQLKQRVEEGKILSKEEIQEIGYNFFVIQKLDD